MRIVCINDVFFPDSGYSEAIYPKYWKKLGHDVIVITSKLDKVPETLTSFFGKDNIDKRDKEYFKKYGVRIIRVPIISYLSGRSVYYASIFRLVRKLEPDVVFVSGNDTLIGIQMTLRYSKEKYGLVMDSHMLDMASENHMRSMFRLFYKTVVTPVLLKQRIPVIRVQDDPYVESALGIPLKKAPYISFGSDTLLFHPDNEVRARWRSENQINERTRVVIYAGKLNRSKGADILAKSISNKFTTKNDVVFVIVGNVSSDDQDIEELFNKSENRIIRFPTQKYLALASFYQAADVAVFPKQCSLSFFDVQACGLPVIFEDNNINAERANHNNAVTFSSDSVDDFRKKLVEYVEMSDDELKIKREASVRYIKEKFDYSISSKKYVRLFEWEVNKKKSW